eukprot:TRINITY_DN8488_c0_g1_i2.p1 TRINITY_DN8488_c0_g1~~TRINITY_DN8488_c0_g1_i2.p1  ORF type:complete len:266 (+),score=47.80 TRINITY_DN8488_c0_g1_i2:151-948(+)
MSAARTNLSSQRIEFSDRQLGEGTFRIAYEATYIGGTRNQQAAVWKIFKPEYEQMEDEYYQEDFRVTEQAIRFAEDWNTTCPRGKEIQINQGDVKTDSSGSYLVEPLIRDFRKFTSNSGWIHPSQEDAVLAMEAFSHYTFHRSGGSMIVNDLQGRYKKDRYSKKPMKTRFELTDVAISSRRREYGVTDLGEKGIDSFFSNHVCNHFCNHDGEQWQRPRAPQQWFELSSGTSMLSSLVTNKLNLRSNATFRLGFDSIMEEDEDCDY